MTPDQLERLSRALVDLAGLVGYPASDPVWTIKDIVDEAMPAKPEPEPEPSPEGESLEDRVARLRAYIEYPGNWSAYDSRRFVMLKLLDGDITEWPR
jgi:hypothetical protein